MVHSKIYAILQWLLIDKQIQISRFSLDNPNRQLRSNWQTKRISLNMPQNPPKKWPVAISLKSPSSSPTHSLGVILSRSRRFSRRTAAIASLWAWLWGSEAARSNSPATLSLSSNLGQIWTTALPSWWTLVCSNHLLQLLLSPTPKSTFSTRIRALMIFSHSNRTLQRTTTIPPPSVSYITSV